MKKIVNGVEVEMTHEEIIEREAEILAWANQPDPVPPVISRSQVMRALVRMDIITAEEAERANIEVPAPIAAVLANMSSDNEIDARLTWLNFIEAHIDDPIIAALGHANGMSDDEVKDFFRLAGSI
jgi:hypothetical protein